MPKINTEQETVAETGTETVTETTETAKNSNDKVEETKADAKLDTDTKATDKKEKQDEVDNQLATDNAELLKKIQTLTTEVTQYEALKVEHTQATDRVKALEVILDEVVAEGLKEIPDNLKALMPDQIDAVGKLDWIKKAKKSGLVENTKQVGGVEIGKPMNVETAKVDTSKMSAGDLMRMAFSTVKK